jgi:hypothetical protein
VLEGREGWAERLCMSGEQPSLSRRITAYRSAGRGSEYGSYTNKSINQSEYGSETYKTNDQSIRVRLLHIEINQSIRARLLGSYIYKLINQ